MLEQDPNASRIGRCWWCRRARADLVHLEGAKLAGSPALHLNLYADVRDRLPIAAPLDELAAVRVCEPCAIAFARARQLHDVELREAGIGTRVADRLRRYVGDGSDAD